MEPLIANFGNPAQALFSWAWESDVEGVPVIGGWHDVFHSGETLANQLARLEREAIARGSLPLPSLESKITTGGDSGVDALNAEQDWSEFAAMFGHAKTPVLLETGAYQHQLSRLETDVTFPETRTLRCWRQDGMPQRFVRERLSQIEVDFEEGKLISMKRVHVVRLGDYWFTPTIVGGTPTVRPQVRGISVRAFTPYTTTDNLYLKVTAVASDHYTVKVKLTDAAAYDQTQDIPIGTGPDDWHRLKSDAGIPLGTLAMPEEVWMPAGLIVNDEFKFARRGTEWVPAYADRSLASKEVSGQILLNGERSEFKSAKLTITTKAEAVKSYGGKAASRTRTWGYQNVKLTASREYRDLELRRVLELGEPFSVTIDARTDIQLGASGLHDYGFTFIMPLLVPSGKPATAEKSDTSNESLDAMAYQNSTAFPADLTVLVNNSIPDLLAA